MAEDENAMLFVTKYVKGTSLNLFHSRYH